MSDVVISYARSTSKQAQLVASALRSLGHGVWLDDQIPAHRPFADEIDQHLLTAKAVVVIWSTDAVKSHWVQSEADRARQDGKLVQLNLDGVRLPMPFDRIQCADLTGWTGDLEASGWRKVLASVSELTGSTSPPDRLPAGVAKPRDPLLAVLAFDNLSSDAEMAHFSDGVSEEILHTVSRGADLKVIGRASSFQFRGSEKATAHVANELKATHVLDGSVRRSGSRVRISAQLVESATQTTLWSDRFDRDLSDVFALQDEIAAAVAAALKVAFAPSAKSETIDPAAYDLYLTALRTGRSSFLADPTTLAAAIRLVEQATVLAPRFARAWLYLAQLRGELLHAVALRDEEPEQPYAVLRSRVVDAAETALSLDPSLGETYQVLGGLEPFAALQQREELHKRALAFAPNVPAVLYRASHFSGEVGRTHEALVYAKQAHELDPMFAQAANWYACMLDSEGRYQESRPLWEQFRTLWPDSEVIAWNAISSAANNADWPRFDNLVKTIRQGGLYTTLVRRLVWFGRNLRDPDPGSMKAALDHTREDAARTGNTPLEFLTSFYRLGFEEEVFDLVSQASFAYIFDPELGWAGGIEVATLFSGMHNSGMMRDPRFVGLCAKLGLVDYWTKTERWPDCADDGVLPYDFKAEARRLAAS